MPRGRPKKLRAPYPVKQPEVRREYKTPSELVALMLRYHDQSQGRNRGMFEDCKADIYRLFMLDYNDWRLKEVKATGMSDRVYHEWRQRFERAFGPLEQQQEAV